MAPFSKTVQKAITGIAIRNKNVLPHRLSEAAAKLDMK
jgi:hypothetical protein